MVYSVRTLARDIENRTDQQLLELLETGPWRFAHNLGLLQLAARGHDCQPYLPRIQ
jgi:hypothetical protein